MLLGAAAQLAAPERRDADWIRKAILTLQLLVSNLVNMK